MSELDGVISSSSSGQMSQLIPSNLPLHRSITSSPYHIYIEKNLIQLLHAHIPSYLSSETEAQWKNFEWLSWITLIPFSFLYSQSNLLQGSLIPHIQVFSDHDSSHNKNDDRISSSTSSNTVGSNMNWDHFHALSSLYYFDSKSNIMTRKLNSANSIACVHTSLTAPTSKNNKDSPVLHVVGALVGILDATSDGLFCLLPLIESKSKHSNSSSNSNPRIPPSSISHNSPIYIYIAPSPDISLKSAVVLLKNWLYVPFSKASNFGTSGHLQAVLTDIIVLKENVSNKLSFPSMKDADTQAPPAKRRRRFHSFRGQIVAISIVFPTKQSFNFLVDFLVDGTRPALLYFRGSNLCSWRPFFTPGDSIVINDVVQVKVPAFPNTLCFQVTKNSTFHQDLICRPAASPPSQTRSSQFFGIPTPSARLHFSNPCNYNYKGIISKSLGDQVYLLDSKIRLFIGTYGYLGKLVPYSAPLALCEGTKIALYNVLVPFLRGAPAALFVTLRTSLCFDYFAPVKPYTGHPEALDRRRSPWRSYFMLYDPVTLVWAHELFRDMSAKFASWIDATSERQKIHALLGVPDSNKGIIRAILDSEHIVPGTGQSQSLGIYSYKRFIEGYPYKGFHANFPLYPALIDLEKAITYAIATLNFHFSSRSPYVLLSMAQVSRALLDMPESKFIGRNCSDTTILAALNVCPETLQLQLLDSTKSFPFHIIEHSDNINETKKGQIPRYEGLYKIKNFFVVAHCQHGDPHPQFCVFAKTNHVSEMKIDSSDIAASECMASLSHSQSNEMCPKDSFIVAVLVHYAHVVRKPQEAKLFMIECTMLAWKETETDGSAWNLFHKGYVAHFRIREAALIYKAAFLPGAVLKITSPNLNFLQFDRTLAFEINSCTIRTLDTNDLLIKLRYDEIACQEKSQVINVANALSLSPTMNEQLVIIRGIVDVVVTKPMRDNGMAIFITLRDENNWIDSVEVTAFDDDVEIPIGIIHGVIITIYRLSICHDANQRLMMSITTTSNIVVNGFVADTSKILNRVLERGSLPVATIQDIALFKKSNSHVVKILIKMIRYLYLEKTRAKLSCVVEDGMFSALLFSDEYDVIMDILTTKSSDKAELEEIIKRQTTIEWAPKDSEEGSRELIKRICENACQELTVICAKMPLFRSRLSAKEAKPESAALLKLRCLHVFKKNEVKQCNRSFIEHFLDNLSI